MSEGNTYRDGHIHVMGEECPNCLFHPKDRLVDASRVKELVSETKDTPGATFTCHLASLCGQDAICAGWMKHFGKRDPILQMAESMGVIKEVPLEDFPHPPLRGNIQPKAPSTQEEGEA